jgi:hypothetical protein
MRKQKRHGQTSCRPPQRSIQNLSRDQNQRGQAPVGLASKRKSVEAIRCCDWNSDEHGIERVSERGGNPRDLGGQPLAFNEYREHVIQDIRDGKTGEIKAENIPVILHGPSLIMIRVHDRRFGDYCDPPIEHMGKTIELEDNSLIGVAALGLAYLSKLVGEAEKLV